MAGFLTCPIANLNLLIEDEELKKKYVERINKHNSMLTDDNPDAGFDIMNKERVVIEPGESARVKMGIKCNMTSFSIANWNPKGDLLYGTRSMSFYVYLRSSTGSNTSLRLSNSVGIIDSGYRGEIICLLDNISRDEVAEIEPYTRIAQICTPNLMPLKVGIVESFDSETTRGSGGLGSTGS